MSLNLPGRRTKTGMASQRKGRSARETRHNLQEASVAAGGCVFGRARRGTGCMALVGCVVPRGSALHWSRNASWLPVDEAHSLDCGSTDRGCQMTHYPNRRKASLQAGEDVKRCAVVSLSMPAVFCLKVVCSKYQSRVATYSTPTLERCPR